MRTLMTSVLLLAATAALGDETAHRGNSQKLKAAGLEVGAWTVTDHATLFKTLEMGVDPLSTDYPQRLVALNQKQQPIGMVNCDGSYKHHLQGICADHASIYWSFTTTLVKTDLTGKLLKQVPVANHHGDLCHVGGKIYVAVNLGKFNDPNGNADSWVYVYDAKTLNEVARHETQEVIYGAGGIGNRDGHFFVVGGLPNSFEENYVYEYDSEFKFLKKHVVDSGHTHLGIQTATFAHDRWWFGCYGDPKILLVTDTNFQMKGRFEVDCSLGIEGMTDGRLLVGSGRCSNDKGCNGNVRPATHDEQSGFKF